jgi:hypothetical protein
MVAIAVFARPSKRPAVLRTLLEPLAEQAFGGFQRAHGAVPQMIS